jgi:hypothetical protein
LYSSRGTNDIVKKEDARSAKIESEVRIQNAEV